MIVIIIVPKTVNVRIDEDDEYRKPTKSSVRHAEYTASDSQVQLLAFP